MPADCEYACLYGAMFGQPTNYAPKASDTFNQMKRVFKGWFRRDKGTTKMLHQQKGLRRQISSGHGTNTHAQTAAAAAVRLQTPASSAPPPIPALNTRRLGLSRPPSVPLLDAARPQSQNITSTPTPAARASSDMIVSPITPTVAAEPAPTEQDSTSIRNVTKEEPITEDSTVTEPTVKEASVEEPTAARPTTEDPTIEGFVFSDVEDIEPVTADHEESREDDRTTQEVIGTEPHALTTEVASPTFPKTSIAHAIPEEVTTVDDEVESDEHELVEEEMRRKDSSMADLSKEELPLANNSARREPAAFHDEKIPVLAEPPAIRMIVPVDGMVATSGPLEDFPFRY